MFKKVTGKIISNITEKNINEFIQNDNYCIRDVKFQDGNSCYSALILYYEI